MAAWRHMIRRAAAAAAGSGVRQYTTNELVGFIGLGNMGGPMAQNLIQKGHQLVVYDVVKASMDVAVAAGAIKADSPFQVASQADTVITMLPAQSHVYQCYEGADGILGSVRAESLFVDCSTIDQNTVKDIANKTSELGGNYLDSPVSGGVGAATKGTLAFMVGGAKDSYVRSVPLLECMGRAAIHCGTHGSGQAAKVCNNMLLAVSMIATSEALQLGTNLGLDPKTLTSIINIASGRCWSSDTYNPCPGVMEGVPSSNNYQGGFRTELMTKDLQLAMEAVGSTKSVTPMGAMATQLYQLLCEQGHSDKDFSYIFKFIEKKN